MNPPTTIDELRSEVLAAAEELFHGDRYAANAWLNRPLRALGSEKPVDHLGSPGRICTLREIIGRLEHRVWT